MATVDFYNGLDYDFSIYNEEDELRGLTVSGFKGNNPFEYRGFNELELKAARDVVTCFFTKVQSINTNYSSYGLKHLVERYLSKFTRMEINYVSNGALILAMYDAGFRLKRLEDGSPNCYFNVSQKSIKKLEDLLNR